MAKKQEPVFRINAFYSMAKYPDFKLDPTIRGLVGKPEVGAGSNLLTRIRDLGFEFGDLKLAKKALARLKKAKVRAELAELAA